MKNQKKGDLIPGSHFDVMLVKPINDSRLNKYTKRSRNGQTQVFFTGNDSRDFERYNREGGTRERNVKMHDKPDTINMEPPEKHYFAELINGVWWWVNGCAECCGHVRNWMTYVECDNHNVCAHCKCNRHDLTEAPWGRSTGWVCKPCADKEHEIEKQEALDAMPEDYDEWDYSDKDEVTCPHCNYEFSDSAAHHHDSDELLENCPRCDGQFTVTANHSVTFDTKKVSSI